MDAGNIRLTEKIQLMWFQLLKKSSPLLDDAQVRKAFARLVAPDLFITNNRDFKQSGTNGKDFVNRTGFDNDWIRYESIITGGNIVQITGKKFTKYRKEWYPIRTINASDFDTNEILSMPLPNPLVYFATNSMNTKLSNGTLLVDRFWQLNGYDVPVPLMSNSFTNAIPAERVQIVSPPFPSPYNP